MSAPHPWIAVAALCLAQSWCPRATPGRDAVSVGSGRTACRAPQTASRISPASGRRSSGPEFDIEAHGPRKDAPPGLGHRRRRGDSLHAGGPRAAQEELRRARDGRSAAQVLHARRAARHLLGRAVPDLPAAARPDAASISSAIRCGPSTPTARAIPTGTSTSGWATRARRGRATRWSSTSSTSTARPGSIAPATTPATRLHVVERWRLVDANTLEYRATLEDAKVYTRPWSLRVLLHRRREPNAQLLENYCYTLDYDQVLPGANCCTGGRRRVVRETRC